MRRPALNNFRRLLCRPGSALAHLLTPAVRTPACGLTIKDALVEMPELPSPCHDRPCARAMQARAKDPAWGHARLGMEG